MKRLRRAARALALLLSLTTAGATLPGCWNSKDIQNLAYVTAIGIDYADGKFISHVQVLNFSNIARSENAQLGKPVPIWLGQSEGRTLTESFTSIYATAQMRIFWGHVKAIVFSESAMKSGVIREVFNMINRYREIRYTVLYYGTRENMDELFTQKSIFNLSPLDTIMFTPEQIYAQRSFILPVYGNRFLSELNEPAMDGMLPSLSIDREHWKEEKRGKTMFRISGAFFFEGMQMKAWLSEDELRGVRWTQRRLQRSPVNVPSEGPVKAALILIKPRFVVKTVLSKDEARYDIKLYLDGYVEELVQNASVAELERMAEEVVETDIRYTYMNGLRRGIDPFGLQETLYRSHAAKWKQLHDRGLAKLKPSSLRNVVVSVRLSNTGRYKGRVG